MPQPAPILVRLGRRVAELREGRGWVQEEFAERLKVLVGYLARIEGGRENLTVLSLAKIARVLKVDVSDLFAAPAARGKRRPGRPRKKRE